MIHCIGDSHVCVFSGQNGIDKKDISPYFKTYRIGAPTAYNSYRYLEKITNIINTYVVAGDKLLFSFGEIDCRSHIIKHTSINKSIEDVVSVCVSRYGKLLKTISQFGFPILVWNVIPTSPKDIFGNYATVGSYSDRMKVTKIFNQMLKDFCLKNNLTFVSIYDIIVDTLDVQDRSYFLDDIHLSQKALPLIIQELNKLGEL